MTLTRSADELVSLMPHACPPPAEATGESKSRFAGTRRWRRAVVAAVVVGAALLLAGVGGRELVREKTGLPPLAELVRDTDAIYIPAQNGRAGWRHWLTEHSGVTALAKLAVVAVNHEIDSRILGYAGLVVHIGAVTLLLIALGLRRLTTVATIAVGVVIASMLPRSSGPPSLASFSAGSVVLFLGAAQLAAMLRGRGTASVATGFACGVLNLLTSSAGIAVPTALVLWGAAEIASRRPISPRMRLVMVANIALALAGIGLVVLRTVAEATIVSDPLVHGAGILAWPFTSPPLAVVAWLPALVCLALEVLRRCDSRRRLPGSVTSPSTVPLVLALWALFQAVAATTFAADDLLIRVAGLACNALCALCLPATMCGVRNGRFVIGAGWATTIAVALLQPPLQRPPDHDHERSVAAALAHALRSDGDTTSHDLPGSEKERRNAEAVVRAAAVREILPVAIRSHLPLVPDGLSPAFLRGQVPPLSERDDLPAFGTWAPKGLHRTGEFASEPMTTAMPVVQLRVGGSFRPPTTDVVLRTASGKEIRSMTGPLEANDRWRRINFETPREPFRVVARSADASRWLAITAPIEIGVISRFMPKIPERWPAFPLGVGLVVTGGIAFWLAWRAIGKSRRPVVPWSLVPWIALFGYALYFSHHLDPTAGPNDSGGYLNSAKLLADGTTTAVPRTISGVAVDGDITPYVPITFHAEHGRLVPEYPVGWPLEVAVVAKITGLQFAVPFLILGHLLAGIVLTKRLAMLFGLPRTWAWLAAAIVGLSPIYLFEGLQPVSDVAALVWVAAAIELAWWGRERVASAALAGAALAAAVMVRPSNLLAGLPLLVCLGWRWRPLLSCAVAGLPGAVWLAWYQQHLYGNWHTTGYGDISTSFGLQYLMPTLRSYGTWLPELLTPLVVAVVAVPFVRTIDSTRRLVLTSWIAVFVAFYAVYWCTWDNWYNMRFLLPAFPAVVIAMLLVVRAATLKAGLSLFSSEGPVAIRLLSVVVTVSTLGWLGYRSAERRVTYWADMNHKPGDAARWAREHLPADAVVFAKHTTGSLFYYTNLTFVRLDWPEAQRSAAVYDRITRTARPIYAMTFHWETHAYHWENGRGSGYPDLPGTWLHLATLGEGEIHVWKLAPPIQP